MFNATLTIDASPRLVNAITLLAGALSGFRGHQVMPAIENPIPEPSELKQLEVQKQQGTQREQEMSGQPEELERPNQQPESKQEQAAIIKPEDLRAVAVTKDKTKVKALLDKWQYKSLSSVPETDRLAFMTELRGL